MDDKRDTFVFYPSFLDAIELLPEDEQVKAYRAITHYGIYGEISETESDSAKIILYMAMPSIDNAKKNRKNGGKGGRPQKKSEITSGYLEKKPVVMKNETEKENKKPVVKEEKPVVKTGDKSYEDVHEDVYEDINNIYIPETDKTEESEPEENPGDKKTEKQKKQKPARHKYGVYENVLLSDTDIATLKQEFPADWQGRIEKLSEYMASTGKPYKNHLATIRSWARKDADKQKPLPPPANNQPVITQPAQRIKTQEEKQKDEEMIRFLEDMKKAKEENM